MAAPNVLDECMPGQDHSGVAVPLEAAHRAQPCLQPAVISFDSVVSVLLGALLHLL
jgi:hypothetical protein